MPTGDVHKACLSPSLDDILSDIIDGKRNLAEIAFDEALRRSSRFAPYQDRSENRSLKAIANSDSPKGRSTPTNRFAPSKIRHLLAAKAAERRGAAITPRVYPNRRTDSVAAFLDGIPSSIRVARPDKRSLYCLAASFR